MEYSHGPAKRPRPPWGALALRHWRCRRSAAADHTRRISGSARLPSPRARRLSLPAAAGKRPTLFQPLRREPRAERQHDRAVCPIVGRTGLRALGAHALRPGPRRPKRPRAHQPDVVLPHARPSLHAAPPGHARQDSTRHRVGPSAAPRLDYPRHPHGRYTPILVLIFVLIRDPPIDNAHDNHRRLAHPLRKRRRDIPRRRPSGHSVYIALRDPLLRAGLGRQRR